MGRGASRCTWQAWESPDKTVSFQVGVERKVLPRRCRATVGCCLERCEAPGEGFRKTDGYGSICYTKQRGRPTALLGANVEGRKTGRHATRQDQMDETSKISSLSLKLWLR